MLLFRWLGYTLVLGANIFALVEYQRHQLFLVYALAIIVLILLVLDVPHKLYVSCSQISLEQVLNHVATTITSCGEHLIVDLCVFIEYINVGVYRDNVGIYTGQVIPRIGVCGPGLYDGLLEYYFEEYTPQGLQGISFYHNAIFQPFLRTQVCTLNLVLYFIIEWYW